MRKSVLKSTGTAATSRPRTRTSPVSDPSSGEHRRCDERIATSFPVTVNGSAGKTRDISASGIFFEVDENTELGSKIHFSVQLDTPGGLLKLVCEGEVIRLEKRDGKLGVAAKILSQEMESA
jgi:hypothetical protein